jgi:hypothetical protein
MVNFRYNPLHGAPFAVRKFAPGKCSRESHTRRAVESQKHPWHPLMVLRTSKHAEFPSELVKMHVVGAMTGYVIALIKSHRCW